LESTLLEEEEHQVGEAVKGVECAAADVELDCFALASRT
jgi:hypothetical protein